MFEMASVSFKNGVDITAGSRKRRPEVWEILTCMDVSAGIDWSECQLVEVKADVQHGRSVLKGTRMPVDDIVDNWQAGVEESEIAELFRLPLEQVKAILAYAADHKNAPHPVR